MEVAGIVEHSSLCQYGINYVRKNFIGGGIIKHFMVKLIELNYTLVHLSLSAKLPP